LNAAQRENSGGTGLRLIHPPLANGVFGGWRFIRLRLGEQIASGQQTDE
jgi:hypothetical protein